MKEEYGLHWSDADEKYHLIRKQRLLCNRNAKLPRDRVFEFTKTEIEAHGGFGSKGFKDDCPKCAELYREANGNEGAKLKH